MSISSKLSVRPVRKGGSALAAGVLLIALSVVGMGCGVVGGGETSPPSAPSGLEAESGSAEVTLDWGAVAAGDLDGYNLYRATTPIDSVSSAQRLNDERLSDTTFTDSAVENGTVYHYRVTAVDENDNESGPSAEVQVRPFAEPPRPD